MNILGISCYYHDSASALLQDGKILFAGQEERFNRVKNSPEFPHESINAAFQTGGIMVQDIHSIAFYEKPFLKFGRVLLSHLRNFPGSLPNFVETIPYYLEDRLAFPIKLKKELGFDGKAFFILHHLSHAASSFLFSPFEEAAILTGDGVGEWATMLTGRGRGLDIEVFREIHYPDSLGLLYTTITTFLGFEALRGEGKVMALGDYGEPRFLDEFRELMEVREDGSHRMDPRYFSFLSTKKMYTRRMIELFGEERGPGEPLEERHYDIAASLQRFTEDTLITIARNLRKKTGLRNLCLAGGLFLNCKANSRILEETDFEEAFIQPAAGDSGGALGSAAYVYHTLFRKERETVMTNAFLGPEYTERHIERFLRARRARFRKMEPDELIRYTAGKIKDDRIVGWFQGRMEFGPRALGHRSILANPCNPGMKDTLNEKVKHREGFRPYGVSILLEDVGEYFLEERPSPFMLLVARVRGEKRGLVPSAVHVDGTSRLHTVTREDDPLYYDLLMEFKRITGIPMIINTSFNRRNEPIVCSPENAYECFTATRMDCLILERFVVEKGEEGK